MVKSSKGCVPTRSTDLGRQLPRLFVCLHLYGFKSLFRVLFQPRYVLWGSLYLILYWSHWSNWMGETFGVFILPGWWLIISWHLNICLDLCKYVECCENGGKIHVLFTFEQPLPSTWTLVTLSYPPYLFSFTFQDQLLSSVACSTIAYSPKVETNVNSSTPTRHSTTRTFYSTINQL